MMKPQICTTVMAIVLAAGCAVGADTRVEASLDANFTLRVGETARVSTEEIEITFLSVNSDSRCAKGETCIWEGDAELQISVSIRGKDFGEYTLHTNEREGWVASFGAFHVRLLSLSPAAIERYVASMRVAKGYAGNDGIH